MSFLIIYYCECVWGFSLASSYLGFEEWYSLVGSIDDEKKRLIFDIFYYAGCSESELINIKFSDINYKSSSIKFKNRVSAIPMQLSLKLKSIKHTNSSDYLFSSRQSSKMSSKRIQQIVSETSMNNFGKRITPQDIRTLHVCHALIKNQSILSISDQTGLTTQRIAQIVETYKNILKRNAMRYEL